MRMVMMQLDSVCGLYKGTYMFLTAYFLLERNPIFFRHPCSKWICVNEIWYLLKCLKYIYYCFGIFNFLFQIHNNAKLYDSWEFFTNGLALTIIITLEKVLHMFKSVIILF